MYGSQSTQIRTKPQKQTDKITTTMKFCKLHQKEL